MSFNIDITRRMRKETMPLLPRAILLWHLNKSASLAAGRLRRLFLKQALNPSFLSRFSTRLANPLANLFSRCGKGQFAACLDGDTLEEVKAERRFDHLRDVSGRQAERDFLKLRIELSAPERPQLTAVHRAWAYRVFQRLFAEALG